MMNKLLLLATVVFVAGCSLATPEPWLKSEQPANPGGVEVTQFITKEGLECVTLGAANSLNSGITCNWEKYNKSNETKYFSNL